MVVVLFPMPLIDEIIGKRQFEALCKANGIESADVSTARGKRVKLEVREPRLLKGTMVPIEERDRFYKDVDTDEVLIHHKSYFSPGGWLKRYPFYFGVSKPMLFSASCGNSIFARDVIFSGHDILLIN
jgi:hypothetical protein